MGYLGMFLLLDASSWIRDRRDLFARRKRSGFSPAPQAVHNSSCPCPVAETAYYAALLLVAVMPMLVERART